jgi:hypothetical protein
MPYTNTEIQRRFKEKMYKAGLKQIILWVKRREPNSSVKMTHAQFVGSLKKITAGWEGDSLSQLYKLLIKIVKGKKEADRLKK